MCRISEYNHNHIHGFPCINHLLKLTTFTLNLSLHSTSSSSNLPETLTLVFLPRVNGARIQVNGSKIRSDSPAFLTLYRTRAAAYSAEMDVRVPDGAAFEVHAAEIRVLKGVFREVMGGEWRVECRYMGDERGVMGVKVREMEVVVGEGEGEGEGMVREKVKMKGFKRGLLEEIPEVMEDDAEVRDEEEVEEEEDCNDATELVAEGEMDGASWVVEVGFWVGCLGVGLLVSRVSSSRSLWRRKLLL